MERPLSRLMPCTYCEHDEHVMRCDAIVAHVATCPCRDVPVPGVHPLIQP